MSYSGKTLVTIATYNEMENLPTLVEEVLRYAPEADVLVIDDNSPDGTGQWCDKKGRRRPAGCLSAPHGQAWARHGHHRRHEVRHRARLPIRAKHGRRLQPPAEISAGAAGRHGVRPVATPRWT